MPLTLKIKKAAHQAKQSLHRMLLALRLSQQLVALAAVAIKVSVFNEKILYYWAAGISAISHHDLGAKYAY